MLYCIRCEQMVNAQHAVLTGLVHIYDDGWDMDWCEFPDGWATVQPPEFDLEAFVKTAEPEPEDVALVYGCDVETDQVFLEDYTV